MPVKTQQQEQAQKQRYLKAIARIGTLTGGCRAAKVSPHTVYAWREHDDAFKLAEHEAREECADQIEASVIRRAKNRSDTLAIFMLKAMRPEKYRDRQWIEHSGPEGEPIAIDVEHRSALSSRIASLVTRAGTASMAGRPE